MQQAIFLYKCLSGVVLHAAKLMWIPTFNLYVRKLRTCERFPCRRIAGTIMGFNDMCHSLHWDLAPKSTAAYAKNGLAGSTDTHCDSPNSVREGLVLSRALCSGFGAVIPLQLTPEWLKVHPQPSVFFTYLRWFVWPTLRRVLVEDWKCLTFPGKVSWGGVFETCHSESYYKS